MIMSIDELNTRSMPYDEFFGEMDLTEEQIAERIELAEELFDIYMFFMIWMEDLIEKEATDYGEVIERVASDWAEAAGKRLYDEEFVLGYATWFANNAVEATLRHTDDPWYFSEDRAIFNAENETLTVFNRADYLDAVNRGMTAKTWHCCMDGRERKSHGAADGQTVGMFDFFHVGAANLFYPRDITVGNGAEHPREIINCRCWMKYSEGTVADSTRKAPEELRENTNSGLQRQQDNVTVNNNLPITMDLQYFAQSEHARERQEERGFTREMIDDAIRHPLADPYDYFRHDEKGRPEIRYVGKEVTVIVNPETGVEITYFRTNKGYAKRLIERNIQSGTDYTSE